MGQHPIYRRILLKLSGEALMGDQKFGIAPEVVLLGTGARLRFPRPEITRALVEAHIGLEVMDAQAACRTFNILVAEGRRVARAVNAYLAAK